CTCNEQGTLPTYCSEGICHCDQTTGHCPCRANVVEKNCDRCAQNFWGFGSDLGCQPCNCDPTHSLRADCNMFTGQCHCQPGFGGRVCSHCQENHWGDPEEQCLACKCDPIGSESPQCDRLTGHCLCHGSFMGRNCNQCRRGFQKNFPHCSPCHKCFGQWDLVLNQLNEQLQRLQERVRALKEGGPIPEASNSRLRSLESSLAWVEQLLMGRKSLSGPVLQQLNNLLADTRADMDKLWDHLQDTDSGLDSTEWKVTEQRSHLNALNEESFRSIVEYFQQSEQALRQANASVRGRQSPVVQAKHTRVVTVELLRQRGEAFRKRAAARQRTLNNIQRKVDALHLNNINQKICGGSGEEACEEASCGGASCKDSSGQRHCGGPGCTGALPLSLKALHSAQNISQQLETTASQLVTIVNKVQEVQNLAQDARSHTQDILDYAQGARNQVEKSTAKLREFIQKIKDFLAEEGADPESIELVAQQVLNIPQPISQSEIDSLIKEIWDRIGQLNSVDVILNCTVQNLTLARDLLTKAEQAREKAEGVQEMVAETSGALDSAKDKAVSQLETLLNKELRLERRLKGLAQDVATLQKKSQDNQRQAQQATGKAERATNIARRLKNEVDEVKQNYQNLQDELEKQPKDVLLRLKNLREEAQNLLDKANSSKRKLEELEKRFGDNERKMASKTEELQKLEATALGLLRSIQERAIAYATC
ncbi:Laminin subunit beta-4, partial [Ophiophagus hannah]